MADTNDEYPIIDQSATKPRSGPIAQAARETPAWNAAPYGVLNPVINAIAPYRNRAVPDQPYGNVYPATVEKGRIERGYESGVPTYTAPVRENSVIGGTGTLQASGPIHAIAETPTVSPASPVGIAGGASMPAPMIGASTNSTYNPAATQQALDAYRARDLQDQQGRANAMQQNANWAGAWTDRRDAESNARVANWNAENARLDLAGGIGNRASAEEAARLSTLAAGGANERAKGAIAAEAAASQLPQRGYIDEYGKLQKAGAETTTANAIATTAGARVTEAGARATEAGSRSDLERAQAVGLKLNNEQHQKIMTLSDAMGRSNSPEEIQKLERQMLALAGKSPDNWGIHVARGEERFVNGMPAGRDADTVFLFNKGTKEFVKIGGGSEGNGRAPPEDRISELKKNDTPQMRAYFDQAYGQGAAVRALGK